MPDRSADITALPLPVVTSDREGTWDYAAGRSWVMERRLLGKTGMERLASATTEAAIRQTLLEHQYPPQDETHAMLDDEYEAVFSFLRDNAPDDVFRTVLLLPRDAHNLKVFLKEQLQGNDARSFEALKPSLLGTTVADPYVLYEAVRGVKEDIDAPDWALAVIRRAREAYHLHYDAASLDLSVDRDIETIRARLAERADAPWFSEALAVRRDLVNFETLLRSRLRGVSATRFRLSLLPEGLIGEATWEYLYGAERDAIKETLAGTSCEALLDYVDVYGSEGTAASFLEARERQLRERVTEGLREAADVRRVLYYVLSRVMEIRQAKMALTRVSLLGEEAKEMNS